MITTLTYITLFALAGGIALAAPLLIGRFVRPNKMNSEKGTIYECGEPTIGESFVQFDLRFYVVALIFLIFDVEIAFFFPWANVYDWMIQQGPTYGLFALLDMLFFFGVLLVGFAYLWRMGDLDWVRSTESSETASASAAEKEDSTADQTEPALVNSPGDQPLSKQLVNDR